MNTWQHIFPKYGNWGGPGWSGGSYPQKPENTDWSVIAVDSLDELFKEHDRSYQTAIKLYNGNEVNKEEMEKQFIDADKMLVSSVGLLNNNPRKWINPAKNVFYGWLYSKLVLMSFYPKIWIT